MGQTRYQRRQITVATGALTISVPLRPSDRFLTVATTDGRGDEIGHDWIVFGDPRLELLSFETSKHDNTDGH